MENVFASKSLAGSAFTKYKEQLFLSRTKEGHHHLVRCANTRTSGACHGGTPDRNVVPPLLVEDLKSCRCWWWWRRRRWCRKQTSTMASASCAGPCSQHAICARLLATPRTASVVSSAKASLQQHHHSPWPTTRVAGPGGRDGLAQPAQCIADMLVPTRPDYTAAAIHWMASRPGRAEPTSRDRDQK